MIPKIKLSIVATSQKLPIMRTLTEGLPVEISWFVDSPLLEDISTGCDVLVYGPDVDIMLNYPLIKRTSHIASVVISNEKILLNSYLDTGVNVVLDGNEHIQSIKKQFSGVIDLLWKSKFLKCSDLIIDLKNHDVYRGNQFIQLRNAEFSILKYFMENSDLILNRDQIMRNVFLREQTKDSNVIDVWISSLRQKIDKPFDSAYIQTVIGQGYKFLSEPRYRSKSAKLL